MPSAYPFVTVIGAANVDIHGKPFEALRPNDSNPGTVHTSAGGVARNAAENLARLEVDCRLISVVGDDDHGRTLTDTCRGAGIDMRYVREIPGARTSTYLSVLDDTGDMQVAVADMGIMDHLDVELLRTHQSMLNQSALIILDANLPDDVLAWITGTFATVPIFADTVSTTKAPSVKPYLASIHTLKTSTIEVEALTGNKARTLPQLRRLAARLHDEGVERVFITLGGQGVFYCAGDAQDIEKLTTGQRRVVNAGGAGDAFLAGLAYAWLEDLSLSQTLRFALAAADITLSHHGTCSPALSLAAIKHALEAKHAD